MNNKPSELILTNMIKKYIISKLVNQISKKQILTRLSNMQYQDAIIQIRHLLQIKGLTNERYLNYYLKKLGLNNYIQTKAYMETQSEDIISHQFFKNFTATEMTQSQAIIKKQSVSKVQQYQIQNPLLYIQNNSLSFEQMSNCICAVVNSQNRKGSIIVVEKMGQNQNIIKGLCEEERFLKLPEMIKLALFSTKYNQFIKWQVKKLTFSEFNTIQSTILNQLMYNVIKIDISIMSPLIFPQKVPKFHGITFFLKKPVQTFPKLIRKKGKNSYKIQILAPEQIYPQICNNFRKVIYT